MSSPRTFGPPGPRWRSRSSRSCGPAPLDGAGTTGRAGRFTSVARAAPAAGVITPPSSAGGTRWSSWTPRPRHRRTRASRQRPPGGVSPTESLAGPAAAERSRRGAAGLVHLHGRTPGTPLTARPLAPAPDCSARPRSTRRTPPGGPAQTATPPTASGGITCSTAMASAFRFEGAFPVATAYAWPRRWRRRPRRRWCPVRSAGASLERRGGSGRGRPRRRRRAVRRPSVRASRAGSRLPGVGRPASRRRVQAGRGRRGVRGAPVGRRGPARAASAFVDGTLRTEARLTRTDAAGDVSMGVGGSLGGHLHRLQGDADQPAHRGRQRRRISGPFAHDSPHRAALAGGRHGGAALESAPATLGSCATIPVPRRRPAAVARRPHGSRTVRPQAPSRSCAYPTRCRVPVPAVPDRLETSSAAALRASPAGARRRRGNASYRRSRRAARAASGERSRCR